MNNILQLVYLIIGYWAVTRPYMPIKSESTHGISCFSKAYHSSFSWVYPNTCGIAKMFLYEKITYNLVS